MLIGTSEEVPAVGESDLTAELDSNFLESLKILLEDIHHANFVSKTNNNMES
jgi:hypothetical protein